MDYQTNSLNFLQLNSTISSIKNTFDKINKIQKKHKTAYPILFKDNNEIIGYSSFNGYGWYKDLKTKVKNP